MKKLLLAAVFLFGVTLTFTACNNGAYDANPDTDLSNTGNPLNVPGGAYYMNCQVDGETYTGKSNFVATTTFGIAATSQGTVSNTAGDYQLLVSVNSTDTGSYADPVNQVSITLGQPSDPMNSFTDVDNTAKVKITEVTDSYINGTFEGKLRNGGAYKYITNGTFHVKKI